MLTGRIRNTRRRSSLRRRCFVLATVMASLAASSLFPVLAAGSMSLQRVADPVTISGERLEPVLGSEIDSLRVVAFDGERGRVIPFQIDERDSAGNWVWDRVIGRPDTSFEEDEEPSSAPTMLVQAHVHTRDDEDPPGAALFDANDVLVFLARDAGDRHAYTPGELAAGRILEIALRDPVDGGRGWVYLVSFPGEPPLRSTVSYMRHLRGQRRIQAPGYDFSYSDERVACLDDLRINGRPVLDRINIRGRVEVKLGFIEDSIDFDEEDIHGYIEGIIEGPVRIIQRNIVHVDIMFMLRTADTVCEHFYYPDFARVPLCLPIRFPVTRATVLLLARLDRSAIRRALVGEIDGTISRYGEASATCPSFHELPVEWLVFDTPHGSVLSILDMPRNIAAHVDVRPCLCVGEDTAMAAGVKAGALPVAGFAVSSAEGTPGGSYVLHGTYLVSKTSYRPGDELAAYRLSHEPLQVRVREAAASFSSD